MDKYWISTGKVPDMYQKGIGLVTDMYNRIQMSTAQKIKD